MGVDYNGVGGIGVEFTDDMAERAIERGMFSREDWEADRYMCMEEIGVLFSEAGNSYSSDTRFYLLVEGETLKEINNNAGVFVEKVSKLLPDLSVDTLRVINDMHIW